MHAWMDVCMYPHETPRKTGTQHVSKTLGEAWEACVFVVQSKLLKDLLNSRVYSSPYIIPNNSPHNAFPHSLLSTRE